MTSERVASFLDAIYEAAAGAADIIAGMTEEQFLLDRKAKLAGTMTMIIIGEAAARIVQKAPEYAAEHPEIDWLSIRGMRNRSAHGYDRLDFKTVWYTLIDDLPVLAEQVRVLLEEFGGPLPPETRAPE